MAIKKTDLSYDAGKGHVVITGPISGTVQLDDGTTYDVTDTVIEVASPEHAAEVAHQIGLRQESEQSHPNHDADVPFVYTPPKKKKG